MTVVQCMVLNNGDCVDDNNDGDDCMRSQQGSDDGCPCRLQNDGDDVDDEG